MFDAVINAVPLYHRDGCLRRKVTTRRNDQASSVTLGNLSHARSEISTPAVRVALNWDEVAGRWKQFTGKAQQRWGKLTDDDLTVATGRRDELIGKIQARYGISKDEADRQVDSCSNSLDP